MRPEVGRLARGGATPASAAALARARRRAVGGALGAALVALGLALVAAADARVVVVRIGVVDAAVSGTR